jgi:long-chain acyl-CoA synthetase
MHLSRAGRTVADGLFVMAEADPGRTALRYKVDGDWRDESFGSLAGRVRALAAGFAASGIAPGERVCVLADTSPEWTYVSLALLTAGAVVVPIYPSASVPDCAWIIADSGATTVFCDSPAQRDKALAAGGRTVLMPDSLTVANESTVDDRLAALRPDDLAVIIYTSGTTGPPKGCMLTHRNWLAVVAVNDGLDYITRDDVVYLFLPLAHVFAQMIQFSCVGCGATLVYGDRMRVIPEISEVRPTFLPSVPRVFEKLYTALTASLDPATVVDAVDVGWEFRRLQRNGEPIPAELASAFERFEPLFARVRAAFGGRVRQALSGAAPIAREVLEFFFAAGVPVLEGYGMTETTGLGTVSTLTHFRLGSVGRPASGVEMRVAGDGELLARGPHLMTGYWHNDAATASIVDSEGWLRTGDLATMDEDGYVTITGRKKDIIITAGGKNIAPAIFENELRQSRWISYAVMIGDRRPYPVALITLDEDEILLYTKEHSLPVDVPTLAAHPQVRALVQAVIDTVNARHSGPTQIKRFAILPRDLTIESGELTPTLKVKRPVVYTNHGELIESLYN